MSGVSLPGAQAWKDGLLLLSLALFVLPLLPATPLELLGGMNPRALAGMVLLIMAMQAAGQLALRMLGLHRGLLLSGFVSGFVSSTASVASLGSEVRARPQQLAALSGAAAMSGSATWLQALILSAPLSPGLALALLPAAMGGALGAMACGALLARHSSSAAMQEQQQAPDTDTDTDTGSALRPREAILVVLMLSAVAMLVSNAQRHLGETAAGFGVALAGLLDAHAPIASLAGLHAVGRISVAHCVGGVLLAISANTLTRCAVAAVAGGRNFALRLGASLLVSLALAWLLAWAFI